MARDWIASFLTADADAAERDILWWKMTEPPNVPSQDDPDLIVPDNPEKEAFVRGPVQRGEAVEPKPDGTLPPGATHVIVGQMKNGLPIVKRVRFSAF